MLVTKKKKVKEQEKDISCQSIGAWDVMI